VQSARLDCVDPAVAVSAREREVLSLLGEHLTHEEIGRRLFISVRTVESHVASLRRKLGISDHRGLVRYAARHVEVPARHGTVPVALTSFVGRDRELHEVLSAIDDSRLVSVVGTGGVGKTRLAMAAAEALPTAGMWSGSIWSRSTAARVLKMR